MDSELKLKIDTDFDNEFTDFLVSLVNRIELLENKVEDLQQYKFDGDKMYSNIISGLRSSFNIAIYIRLIWIKKKLTLIRST